MGRPGRSWAQKSVIVFLAIATTAFTKGSNDTKFRITENASRSTAPARIIMSSSNTEPPPGFPSIELRLIVVSILIFIIILLVVWILLSRRVTSLHQQYILDPSSDIVQNYSWMDEPSFGAQMGPEVFGAVDPGIKPVELQKKNEESFLSNLINKFRDEAPKKPTEGAKQPLTRFTLPDNSVNEESQLNLPDRTGDTRSYRGSDEDFLSIDGSYRGSAYLIPVESSVTSVMTNLTVTSAYMTPMLETAAVSPEESLSLMADGTPIESAFVSAIASAIPSSTESNTTESPIGTSVATSAAVTAASSPIPASPTASSPRLPMTPVTPSRGSSPALSDVAGPSRGLSDAEEWVSADDAAPGESSNEEGPCADEDPAVSEPAASSSNNAPVPDPRSPLQVNDGGQNV